jgi:NAD(P)-dependent dehydrogenase (short-subunit alcohol dehydrogenase family)
VLHNISQLVKYNLALTKLEQVPDNINLCLRLYGGFENVFSILLIADADATACRKILDTNVFGLCLFTREVIKDMRDRGVDDGHIFHINRYARMKSQ